MAGQAGAGDDGLARQYRNDKNPQMTSLLKTKIRSKFDIIAYILQMANGGNKKSKIIMNNFHLIKYFPMLCAHDLLCYDKKDNTFKTTPKGMEFVRMYKELIDCCSNFSLKFAKQNDYFIE